MLKKVACSVWAATLSYLTEEEDCSECGWIHKGREESLDHTLLALYKRDHENIFFFDIVFVLLQIDGFAC